MKILVTGATGFVGSYVVNDLLESGHSVIATSRSREKATQFPWFNNVQYVEYDINNLDEDLYSFFEEPDLLVHLAWEGLPNYGELFHIERNLFSNYFFIKSLVQSGLKKVVVTGTCFEYGRQSGALKEDLGTKPNNPYALAKDSLRTFLEELRKKTTFSFNWIRLFYMYGRGQNPNSILSQLDSALESGNTVFNMSGGEQLRDYLHIEKVSEYIVKISLQENVTGIVNCCNGVPISIRKLVENYLKANGKSIKLNLGHYPYPDYEPMAFWGDIEKLNKAVGSSK